jgi:rhamnose utilization protein RhaD (predicted bifunctional aldolase and dehydrogenase)
MEFLNEYVNMCKLIGPWTDWIQGPGGNFSIKNDSSVLVKQSGFCIANTTQKNGWVLCCLKSLVEAIHLEKESIDSCVIEGTGKPSIEAYLHTFPFKYIMHAHPSFLLPLLTNNSNDPISISNIPSITLPYSKPGIPLVKSLLLAFDPDIHVYFLKNHGILIMNNSLDEIINIMNTIVLSVKPHSFTDITLCKELFPLLNYKLIKPVFQKYNNYMNDRLFLPFTPDICVFLGQMPLSFESGQTSIQKKVKQFLEQTNKLPSVIFTHSMIYVVGDSLEKCNSVQEILFAYSFIPHDSALLTNEEVNELINWDKEKYRLSN